MWEPYKTKAQWPVFSIFVKITIQIFLSILITLLTCFPSQMNKNREIIKNTKCDYLCPLLQYPAICYWDSLSCFHGNLYWRSLSTLAAFENIDPSFSFLSMHMYTHPPKHSHTDTYVYIMTHIHLLHTDHHCQSPPSYTSLSQHPKQAENEE